MVDILQLLIILYVGLSVDGIVSCALISRPRNTLVIVGESATVPCQTNITNMAVYWHYTDVNGRLQPPVFNNGQINPSYEVRNITVDMYDLQFQSVALHDAGTYTCQDANGIGEAQAAWLTVLDKSPECSNKTTAKGVELSCHVMFNGSSVPSNQLEPDPQWHCDPEVVNKSTEVNPVNKTERTFKRLRSSVQLARSHGVNCSFVLGFIPWTSDSTIDSREPTYKFTWTHVEPGLPDPSSSGTSVAVVVAFVTLIVIIVAVVAVVVVVGMKRSHPVRKVEKPPVHSHPTAQETQNVDGRRSPGVYDDIVDYLSVLGDEDRPHSEYCEIHEYESTDTEQRYVNNAKANVYDVIQHF